MFDCKILFLGAVQGLTEFLPVSSSGHLAFFQMLFGYNEPNMLGYDILLHLATLMATLCYFARDVALIARQWFAGFKNAESRKTDGWRYGWTVLLGTLVTILIAFPLKKFVLFAMASPLIIAGGLFLTASALWIMGVMRESDKKVSLKTGLVVGAFQGIAAMPGVSRSGMTIFSGMFSGLAPKEAFKFSFILSIPAIVGAGLLEAVDMYKAGAVSLPDGWWAGGLLAFVLGLLSLTVLKRFVLGKYWRVFSVYCAALASLMVLLRIFS